jgi:molybdate transport system substrate-binding protein
VTRRRLLPALLAPLLLLAIPAYAEDLTVLSAGAISAVAKALIPGFQTSTGTTVIFQQDTVGGLVKRVQNHQPFDVVLMSPAGLKRIPDAIDQATATDLAAVGVGVAIKSGTPIPDISTVEAFKATISHARAVAFVDPAAGATSGIYLAALFKRLDLHPHEVLVESGTSADRLVDGSADIAIQQISELMIPGVTVVGPLPAAIQTETVYGGAIAAKTTHPTQARAFLALLHSPTARPVVTAKGMTPR